MPVISVLAENLVRAGQTGRGQALPLVAASGLVYLRFTYLFALRVVTALRVHRRDDDHKAIEILLPRHQLVVTRRQLATAGKCPKPDWADRASFALLLNLIPTARRAGLRVFVTLDTILRWHGDLLRRR
jgi:putative transposase